MMQAMPMTPEQQAAETEEENRKLRDTLSQVCGRAESLLKILDSRVRMYGAADAARDQAERLEQLVEQARSQHRLEVP